MNICVFLGPTLTTAEAGAVLDAVYLPPAAQGDVYLAVHDGADAIGIIDGYFQGAPAVWHKEILWAMSQGVQVFGAASMGALRAAELHSFGMQGVGEIFRAFRDGDLSSDDEVAVVHGPEELGHAPSTTALVDMRATLQKALHEQVIDTAAHDCLITLAREIPYWERRYRLLLERAAAVIETRLHRDLSRWIEQHAVRQKRQDAIAMLHCIGNAAPEPKRVDYTFQHTTAWRDLVAETHLRASASPENPITANQRGLLDEVRLQPDLYRRLTFPNLSGIEMDPAQLLSTLSAFGGQDALAARAADKYRWLMAEFGALPVYADVMLTPALVIHDYFDQRLAMHVPVDIHDYARGVGFTGASEFGLALLREFLYVAEHPS